MRPTRAPSPPVDRLVKRILGRDPYLQPYGDIVRRRLAKIDETERRLIAGSQTLAAFASGHEYFGLHLKGKYWLLREWAPNASRIFLVGDISGWKEQDAFEFKRKDDEEGVWELRLPKKALRHGDLYRLKIEWPGGRKQELKDVAANSVLTIDEANALPSPTSQPRASQQH